MPHTHVALDDAKEQGALFCNMLADRNRRFGAGKGRSGYLPEDG
jgi:hypothetical protein